MKYRKQARQRDLRDQKTINEFKYHKGVWLNVPIYENKEIVRYERQYVKEIEPDADKLKQLSIC